MKKFAWLTVDTLVVLAGIWSQALIWRLLATGMVILSMISLGVSGLLIDELEKRR